MSVGREVKDPGATEPFSLDFSNDLASGDTITGTPTWTFETAEGLTTGALTKSAQSNSTTVATIRIAGGVDGASYYVVCTVATTNGDTYVRRFLLDVFKE